MADIFPLLAGEELIMRRQKRRLETMSECSTKSIRNSTKHIVMQ